jgi:hypothetical protein
VERHQVDAGVCGCLLALAEDPDWPPTLRDMAAGHLQHLMETHRSLQQLGANQRRRAGDRERERLRWGTAGRGGGRAPEDGRRAVGAVAAKFVTARERADKAKVAAALASVCVADPHRAGGGGGGVGADAAGQDAAAPSPEEQQLAALEAAAGSHLGLVPFMLAMVRLVETGHSLLELRGARGIARTCFAAARGAPAPVALLQQAKATAAEAGAVAALVELLRSTASKYLVLLEGGALPAAAVSSVLSEEESTMYERSMNNREVRKGILNSSFRCCSCMLPAMQRWHPHTQPPIICTGHAGAAAGKPGGAPQPHHPAGQPAQGGAPGAQHPAQRQHVAVHRDHGPGE